MITTIIDVDKFGIKPVSHVNQKCAWAWSITLSIDVYDGRGESKIYNEVYSVTFITSIQKLLEIPQNSEFR